LPPILKASSLVLDRKEILAKLLPDKPSIVAEAAFYLYPAVDDDEERRPFLEKALALLSEPPPPPTLLERLNELLGQSQPGPKAEDLYLEALVRDKLGQKAEALAGYSKALARNPNETHWRFHYAQRLYEEGQLREAERELRTVLAQEPDFPGASALLKTIRRELIKEM
jgi:tetratricopeptide (TPR) repeat protein